MSEQIVFGVHPVLEALRSDQQVDKVFLLQGTRGELEKELRLLCRERQVPLLFVPRERIAQHTHGNHQGVLAFITDIAYYKLADILPAIFEQGETPLIVLLDGVTDVRNLGAIARSAEAAGAHALVVGMKNSAPINGDAMKTAAGALNYLPVCRESSVLQAIETLRVHGVTVMAADLDGAVSLSTLDLVQPLALVFGAEDEGVNPANLRRCHARFYIPIVGRTESYNVSVAAGITLYETMRQRHEAGKL